ncbi:MAG TPA: hypothetical protein VGJ32_09130 [Solirubrobacteraceae bacterium]
MIEATRQMEATIERLACEHGGVRVELYREVAGGPPFAYVRAPSGERWTVPAHGVERVRGNADMAPYEVAG